MNKNNEVNDKSQISAAIYTVSYALMYIQQMIQKLYNNIIEFVTHISRSLLTMAT